MVLPNFLVIGGQRCGTTLLHAILDAHDEVYVPQRRKEIHYFDFEDRFARGVDWYQGFFPKEDVAPSYRAIGEVTPDYLFEAKVPPRIARLLPDCRLVAVLRHPVDRAFSGYLHHVRSFRERRSFEQFIEAQPDARERGFYTTQLARYLELFEERRLHIMIFEELLQDPQGQLDRLAGFLELSHAWEAPRQLMATRWNRGEVPYFQTAFYQARRLGEVLTAWGLDRVVSRAKRMGVPRLFGTRRDPPRMTAASRARLQELYQPEIVALERLLGRTLDVWQRPQTEGREAAGAPPPADLGHAAANRS